MEKGQIYRELKLPPVSKRATKLKKHSFTEDWDKPDGKWKIQCPKCWFIFVGHKDRTLCKLCKTTPDEN
jgi:ribosomal protein S27AE